MAMTKLLRRIARRNKTCAAVIVAAGSATRMNGTDKIMATLGGQPVIAHTIAAFQNCDAIDTIVVVTRQELCGEISQLCVQKRFSKVTAVVRGGDSRMESVRLGLDRLAGKCGLVAIHDGARPLITSKVISDTVRKAAKFGAAAPAVPVKDTIKVVHGGVVESTPERSSLYAVQTPQAFDYDTYRAALQNALEKALPITDDCSAAEQFGLNVVITQGSEENLKITTPSDLKLAEVILAGRAEP